MNSSDVVVLKIGGSVAGEDAPSLDAIASLDDAGHGVVVVHGGGPLVSEWAKTLGLETTFIGGLRVTDEKTRDLALAVLGGLTNARLVAGLISRGVSAVGVTGISGGMLQGEISDPALGLVGRIDRVDSALLEELLENGRVPVIAPAALEGNGKAHEVGKTDVILNVNGDSAAGAIAAAIGARLLVFITDVPGVRAKDGKVIASLDAPRAKELVEDGTIEGGMLPKVEACLVAAGSGCRAAIVAARTGDAVERLLAGERVGTVFEAA